MIFGMDAGDADVEDVVLAIDDGELVVLLVALRAREASTRASGRARADEATTNGDPGWTRETLTLRVLYLPSTMVSVSSPLPPYACAKRRRGRRAARAGKTPKSVPNNTKSEQHFISKYQFYHTLL